MTEAPLVQSLSLGVMACAVLVFIVLFFVSAPYGRHARAGWGPTIENHLGWLIMEAPASLVFLAVFLLGNRRGEMVPIILLVLWQMHYFHRSFIYPFTLKTSGKRAPWLTVLLAIVFNTVNGYANAKWISSIGIYDANWLTSVPFLAGVALFIAGFVINKKADATLKQLRSNRHDKRYSIPYGGLYEYISCPNYFGEILQWTGWAVATMSLPGLAFALFTFANLAPRARSHHAWYHKTFHDYPSERRALIPWIW